MTGQALLVKPISGKLLKNTKKSNVYLIFKYSGQKFVSNYSKNTEKYPFWSETFIFKYIEERDIMIECWDMENGFIGEGMLETSKENVISKNLNWITLSNKDGIMIGELFMEVEIQEKVNNSEKNQLKPISQENIKEPRIEIVELKAETAEIRRISPPRNLIQHPQFMRNMSFPRMPNRFNYNGNGRMIMLNYKHY